MRRPAAAYVTVRPFGDLLARSRAAWASCTASTYGANRRAISTFTSCADPVPARAIRIRSCVSSALSAPCRGRRCGETGRSRGPMCGRRSCGGLLPCEERAESEGSLLGDDSVPEGFELFVAGEADSWAGDVSVVEAH